MKTNLPKPYSSSAQSKGALEIPDETARRLEGHEQLLEKLIVLIEGEATARSLSIIRIEVLPAWSHEYEEKTGIVIQVEVKATDEQRFSLWEGIGE